MRKLYKPSTQSKIRSAAKRMSIEHNVTFNVIDVETGKIVQSHTGHNAATNSLLLGIAHYLIGDGVHNQAHDMLSMYVPRYISLGTMGLFTQEEDENGLPLGLGNIDDTLDEVDSEGNPTYIGDPQTERLCHYIAECPGYGADGYDISENNDRAYFGLGPKFENREKEDTVYCELISDAYPRSQISLRDIVPEAESELPKTIDVIYSAMVSVASLAKFRGYNEEDLKQRDYIFVTEAGLWATKNWSAGGNNGLLAGYRILSPNKNEWDLGTYVDTYAETGILPHYELDPEDEQHAASQRKNQETLKRNILRVGKNQVVQVIWKIQLGGLEQLGGLSELYPSLSNSLVWHFWDEEITYEYPTKADFPKEGIKDVIYLDLSTNTAYIWNGIKYVEMGV